MSPQAASPSPATAGTTGLWRRPARAWLLASRAASRPLRAGICSACAQGGPRRLRTSSCRPSPPGSSATSRRKTAGDAPVRACAGRITNSSLAFSLHAICRRRNCSVRACGSQARTASTSAQRRACSQAHMRAAGALAATHSNCCGARPWAARPGPNGVCGAPTSTTMPWPARARAGSKRRHSFWPLWACRISTSAPTGQPPPGSCASSAAWPLARTAPGERAIVSARQSAAPPGAAAGADGRLVGEGKCEGNTGTMAQINCTKIQYMRIRICGARVGLRRQEALCQRKRAYIPAMPMTFFDRSLEKAVKTLMISTLRRGVLTTPPP